jgi:hypothetical protein
MNSLQGVRKLKAPESDSIPFTNRCASFIEYDQVIKLDHLSEIRDMIGLKYDEFSLLIGGK